MDNFDLKKYLAESKLLKETKMLDIYQDGDVVVDISAATPSQERLIQWETEISDFNDSEEAQEIVDQIMQLNSEDQVYDYYAYERDWKRDSDLKREIKNAVAIFKGDDELNEEEQVMDNNNEEDTVTVKFHIGSITGKPELYPGTDTLKNSVMEALEMAIMNGDEESLNWLIDNIWKIDSI